MSLAGSSNSGVERRTSDILASQRANGKETSFAADAFESDEDDDDVDFLEKVSSTSSPWDDDDFFSSHSSKQAKFNPPESSQNNSFDDPVVFGRASQGRDKSLSSSRKGSPPAADAYKIISSVFANVFDNGSFTKADVCKISTMCGRVAQAGGDDEKKVLLLLRNTLETAITCETIRDESMVAICVIIAKVAVRSYLETCDLPFRVLRTEILGYNTCKLLQARQRICELIGCILSIDETDNCISDLMHDSEEEIDEETASEVGYTLKEKLSIPKLLISEWGSFLCDRRLDKEPLVRCSAVKAIALLPGSTVTDREGKRLTVNKCLLQSLTDVSADVRRSAVSSISFSVKGNVNKCMDFIKGESNSNVRIAMLARLINDVHLSSYSTQQRSQLVQMIHQDSETSISSMISTHLVPKWMKCSSVEVPPSSQELSSTFLFPSGFVSYVDYKLDFGTAEHLMKCAILHFFEKLPVRKNGIEIVTFLREKDVITDVPLLLNPVDVKNLLKSRPVNMQDTFFVHYCLVEVILQIHSDRSDSAARYDCLQRLLPNLTELSSQLKSFCFDVFSKEEGSSGSELIVNLLCRLLRRLDLCDVGLKAWSDCISFIAANARISPPLCLIEFTMNELLEELRSRSTNPEQQLAVIGEWACYSIGEIFSFYFGEDTQLPIAPGSVPSNFQYSLHRSAIILHSILRYPGFTELTTLMQSAFDRLVPLIHPINNVEMRNIAARIIGLACTLNVNVFYQYVNMLRHTLEIDCDEVKDVALTSIVEVVVTMGFKETAKFCFPEIEEKGRTTCLVKLVERCAGNINESYLPDVSRNCIRLVHVGQINWPYLIGSLLLRSFPKTVSSKVEEAQTIIRSFFRHLTHLGPTGRMQILSGFLNALNQLEELDVSFIKLGQMSSFFLTSFLEIKTNNDESPVSSRLNATNMIVSYCYIRETLHHILKYPDGVCVGALVAYTLIGFDFSKINDEHLRKLVDVTNCTSQKLEAIESSYARNMKKFITNFHNAAKERGIETGLKSAAKRKKDIKIEEDTGDLDGKHIKEEPSSSPLAKKRRAATSTPIYDIDRCSDDQDILMDDDIQPRSSRHRRVKAPNIQPLAPRTNPDPIVIELSSDSEDLSSYITIDSKSDDPVSDDIFSSD